MFKAKVIDDPAFYRLRKRLLVLGLPGAALIGFLAGEASLPLPYFVGILGLVGFFIAWRVRTHKQAFKMVRNRNIEISSDTIRLVSPHGKVLETIPVSDLSGVTVKENWAIPEERFQDLVRELKGKPLENYMIIRYGQEERRFDFFLDSYYMIEQLKKVIQDWQARGMAIETVS